MRSAGNFHPDWGYLAAAPSFARTARVVLAATAIGAIAGAAVVLSLIEPSTTETASLASPAIVGSAQAAPTAADYVTARPPARVSPVAAAHPIPAPAFTGHRPGAASAAIAPVAVAPMAAVAPGAASVAAAPVAAAPVAAAPQAAAVPPESPAAVDAALADPPQGDAATSIAPGQSIMADAPAAPSPKGKHHVASNDHVRSNGFGLLRRLFSGHAGPSYYPSHGL
jgi:hypothetical protein